MGYFYVGGWWVRASAQVFNKISVFGYVGKALIEICKEIKKGYLSKAWKIEAPLRTE
ncbi:hypothetical protein EUX98_g985 [Antrodiella citrinella]|uniref:Uncharacterized protein n=1 Tax=Antrodiella citrinella TaxID=2447956 RepID=A0A4S4N5I5_9APHY|nr:hypothetical protein EUX98_g985 [Antrodiella citrinella]